MSDIWTCGDPSCGVSNAYHEKRCFHCGKPAPPQSSATSQAAGEMENPARALANWIEDNVPEISDASMNLVWKKVHEIDTRIAGAESERAAVAELLKEAVDGLTHNKNPDEVHELIGRIDSALKGKP